MRRKGLNVAPALAACPAPTSERRAAERAERFERDLPQDGTPLNDSPAGFFRSLRRTGERDHTVLPETLQFAVCFLQVLGRSAEKIVEGPMGSLGNFMC